MNASLSSNASLAPTVQGDAAVVQPSGGLSHLALLRATGADAPTFLDTQLTRNVPERGATLAGYCSAKGRLLASFTLWREQDGIALLVSRDIAEAIAKRLRMYVLRAKVTIEDVTPTHAIEGLAAPRDAPDAPDVWSVTRDSGGSRIRFPDAAGRVRFLRVAPLPRGPATEGHRTDALDAAAWRWADIQAGLPLITAATQDRFVPQMVNLEALGGVDFKKGCYPGQEVVARSQYLGKLKRRMALASLAPEFGVPAPGSDLWGTATHEPAGVVVDAERGPDGRIALLVELPLALFESDALHAGTSDGPALQLHPLPYPLPDNEVFVRPRL